MKKAIILFIVFLFSFTTTYADITQIKFIYVNGSNANTKKSQDVFKQGVKDIHNSLKQVFSKDEYIKCDLLQNGRFSISSTPYIVFWGFMSKDDFSKILRVLNNSKK